MWVQDWIRTCKTCNHKQTDIPPEKVEFRELWFSRKCNRCRSKQLNEGKYVTREIIDDYAKG